MTQKSTVSTFQELGKRLDEIAEKVAYRTQEGMEKAEDELKDWGKGLDDLGNRIKKAAHEEVGRISGETKRLLESAKLRSEIAQKRKDLESTLRELGESTCQLHLQRKIGHVELKKASSKVTRIRKMIEKEQSKIAGLEGKKECQGASR